METSPAPLRCLLAPLLGALMLLGATACFRQDVREFPVDVPQLHGDACFQIMRHALMAMEGVQDVQPDYPARQIIVTFDSKKLANKNVEYRLTESGFEANGNPPDLAARAQLPPGCR